MNHKLTVEEDLLWKKSYQPYWAPFEPRVFTKECIIRWKIAKDVNKVDEMKI
jgi:hypothetical protein